MEQESNASERAERVTKTNDGGELVENVKRKLGLNDETGKEKDDEMARPSHDRSPLT